MMRLSFARSLSAACILLAVCQSSFAAMLTFSAMARSFNGDFVDDPGTYIAPAFIYLPGTGYEMTSAAGRVTVSTDGISGSSSASPEFNSWADLVAAESGEWKLVTNPGLASQATYFFDVGFGSVSPLPFWIDAYHVAGTPANQARVEFRGPIDSPYTLYYSASTPSGFISQQYSLTSGQDFLDVTVPNGFTNLYLTASRTTYTSAFSFSIPVTAEGIALPDWTISPYVAYIEMGSFHTNSGLRSVAVPDSTGTFISLLGSVTGLVLLRRTVRRRVVTH